MIIFKLKNHSKIKPKTLPRNHSKRWIRNSKFLSISQATFSHNEPLPVSPIKLSAPFRLRRCSPMMTSSNILKIVFSLLSYEVEFEFVFAPTNLMIHTFQMTFFFSSQRARHKTTIFLPRQVGRFSLRVFTVFSLKKKGEKKSTVRHGDLLITEPSIHPSHAVMLPWIYWLFYTY